MRSETANWLRAWGAYGFAISMVVAVSFLKWAGFPALGRDAPFLLMLTPTLLAAWFGGLGPGLVAAVLGTVGVAHFGQPATPVAAVHNVVFGVENAAAAAFTALVRSSRSRTEDLARRLQRLHATSLALGGAETVTDVAEIVAQEVAALGSMAVWIYLADPGEPLRLLAHLGRDGSNVKEGFQVLPLDGALPSALAARTRSPVFIESEAELRARFPDIGVAGSEYSLPGAMFCAPMLIQQRVIGVLGIGLVNAQHFPPAERTWAQALAQECGMAVQRTRSFESERRGRTESEEASHAKEAFLATASHELRAPLTSMLGWANVLKSRVPRAVGRRDVEGFSHGLDVIERSARAQVRLVDDLLDMARVVARRLSIDAKPIALAPLVRATVDELEVVARARGLALKSVVPDGITVTADAGRIRQVVYNVVWNALSFTPPGGHVELQMLADTQRAFIRVRDDGPGIAQSELPNVLVPFHRTHAANARDQRGLGLGLAVAKYIVEEHHGVLRVESEGRGHGTTAIVELPRTEDTPGSMSSANGAGTPAEDLRLNGIRVLLFDEDDDAREALREVFAAQGAEVRSTHSTNEALRDLDSFAPDVVVSSIAARDDNGHRFIRGVRTQQSPLAAVPAIALTASSGADAARDAQASGYQRSMPKPPDPDALVESVASLANPRLPS
jgi:signal transduction histidine kinase